MRAPGRVWSIKEGCVAAACAAMMLPTATMTADQSRRRRPHPARGAPTNPTAAATAADHRNMMQQLGITALRPGPSGNESAPNHANYDEALANPYPSLPQVLTLKTGRNVTSAAAWWNERRPEIVEEFDREVVGRVPNNVPKVTWVVNRTDHFTVGGRPVVGKELIGKVDNSSYPGVTVDIQMTVVTPATTKPVPVMMMFGGRSGMPPAPGAPAPAAPADLHPTLAPPGDRTTDRRRLGLRDDQPRQHSGGQRRRVDRGDHRPGQQGPAPQT